MAYTTATYTLVAGNNQIQVPGADMSLTNEALFQNESDFQLTIDLGDGRPKQLGAWMMDKFPGASIRSTITVTATQLNNPVPSSTPSSSLIITFTQAGDTPIPGVYPATLSRMAAINTNPSTPVYVTPVPPGSGVIITAPTTPTGFTYVTQFDEVGTPLFGVIDQSASGDTQLVAADATHKIRVLSIFVIVGGVTNLRFKDSGGNLSGLLDFAANSGMTNSFDRGIFQTQTNKSLLLNSSAAVQVGGYFTYALAPTH